MIVDCGSEYNYIRYGCRSGEGVSALCNCRLHVNKGGCHSDEQGTQQHPEQEHHVAFESLPMVSRWMFHVATSFVYEPVIKRVEHLQSTKPRTLFETRGCGHPSMTPSHFQVKCSNDNCISIWTLCYLRRQIPDVKPFKWKNMFITICNIEYFSK